MDGVRRSRVFLLSLTRGVSTRQPRRRAFAKSAMLTLGAPSPAHQLQTAAMAAPTEGAAALHIDIHEAVPAGSHRQAAAAQSCGTLSWSDVSVVVHDAKGREREILRRATGVVQPGELCAILGPSGCGKRRAPAAAMRPASRACCSCSSVDAASRRPSTLLDTLAGRLSPGAAMHGSVKVNGHAARLSYGRSAYVTQDEVLIGTLTVRETITYAARLRLRGGPDAPSPAQVADGIVADLGLAEAADTVIGNWHMRGVSGGQRRRVVIGCELVVQPTLLFLVRADARGLSYQLALTPPTRMSRPAGWMRRPPSTSPASSSGCVGPAAHAPPAAPCCASSTSRRARCLSSSTR